MHYLTNTWLRRLLMLLLAGAALPVAKGQSALTINDVYQLARKNYPAIKQRDLITKTKEYSVSNAAKGYLPAFSVNGQATYQSAVTNFPFTIPINGYGTFCVVIIGTAIGSHIPAWCCSAFIFISVASATLS